MTWQISIQISFSSNSSAWEMNAYALFLFRAPSDWTATSKRSCMRARPPLASPMMGRRPPPIPIAAHSSSTLLAATLLFGRGCRFLYLCFILQVSSQLYVYRYLLNSV